MFEQNKFFLQAHVEAQGKLLDDRIYVGAIVTISFTGSCYNKDRCGSGKFDWRGTVTSGKIIKVG